MLRDNDDDNKDVSSKQLRILLNGAGIFDNVADNPLNSWYNVYKTTEWTAMSNVNFQAKVLCHESSELSTVALTVP